MKKLVTACPGTLCIQKGDGWHCVSYQDHLNSGYAKAIPAVEYMAAYTGAEWLATYIQDWERGTKARRHLNWEEELEVTHDEDTGC
jgi:hypothetical protein